MRRPPETQTSNSCDLPHTPRPSHLTRVHLPRIPGLMNEMSSVGVRILHPAHPHHLSSVPMSDLPAEITVEEWVERTRRRGGPTRETDVIEALDELRGPWPDDTHL